MKIAVTDANIFIDLIEIEIFHFLFDLGLEIHTTKAVYDQLIPEQQAIVEPFVQLKALIVYNFSFEELMAISVIDFPPGLEGVFGRGIQPIHKWKFSIAFHINQYCFPSHRFF